MTVRIVEKSYRSLLGYTGQRNCFELGYMTEGFLQAVIVKQVGGSLQAFTVNVFNSKRPCIDGSQSSGGPNPDGFYSADPDMYKVIPTLTQDSPGHAAMLLSDVGYPYRNQDGDETTRHYLIYVEITPAANDSNGTPTTEADGLETTWDVVLRGWTDVR